MLERGPKAVVLQSPGINCDVETRYALDRAGADAKIVNIRELMDREETLSDYEIMAIPGGFANGDDLGAGKVLAIRLEQRLADQVDNFIHQRKGLILGICNGFQILTRSGLLPFGTMGQVEASLEHNASGRFEWRTINLIAEEKSRSVFLKGMKEPFSLQVAHGEGRFMAPPQTLQRIEDEGLVVLRYVDATGAPTQDYPANPNGAMNAIAGITDPSGRILGLMPHPERSVTRWGDPNWRRNPSVGAPGLEIFKKMVEYAAQM